MKAGLQDINNSDERVVWYIKIGGPGVYDPCEKTPTDAFEYLSRQEKEDLTNSAQVRLNYISSNEFAQSALKIVFIAENLNN